MEINNMKSDTILLGQVIKIEYFDSDEEYNINIDTVSCKQSACFMTIGSNVYYTFSATSVFNNVGSITLNIEFGSHSKLF